MAAHTHDHHHDHAENHAEKTAMNHAGNHAQKTSIAQKNHAHFHVHHASSPRVAAPALSLLRMSVSGRLTIALGLIALIWLAVFWALRPS